MWAGVSCGRRIVWEEGVLPFENGAHDTERARGDNNPAILLTTSLISKSAYMR